MSWEKRNPWALPVTFGVALAVVALAWWGRMRHPRDSGGKVVMLFVGTASAAQIQCVVGIPPAWAVAYSPAQ